MRDVMELRSELSAVEDKVAGVIDSLGEVVTKSELSGILLDFGNPAVKRDYLLLNGEPVKADARLQRNIRQSPRERVRDRQLHRAEDPRLVARTLHRA